MGTEAGVGVPASDTVSDIPGPRGSGSHTYQ